MTDLNAKIIPLQTETPGLAPTEVQCDVGEIAVNLTDRKIYSKRSDGTVVTLAGGSKVQDAEDFDLNNYTPPMQRWDAQVGVNCNNMPSITGPGQFLGPSTCWSNWVFYLGAKDKDGNDFGADAWPSTLEAGGTVYLLTNLTADWVSYKLRVKPTWSSSRGWSLSPDSNGLDGGLGSGFAWIQASPSPGPAYVDIPLAYGDAIVWSSDPISGDAFRPRQFKVEKLLDVQLPDPVAARNERDVLQWDTTGQVYKHQALLFDITAAQDFAYQQADPATPRWIEGDWLEDGEFTRTTTQWIFNFTDNNTNNQQAFFERWATATSIWSSADGTTWVENPFIQLEVKPVTGTCEITFEDPAPTVSAALYIAFSEPGVEIDQPLVDGQVMVWNGTHWTPANPTESLALALNDLTDVNTITNPPADGQALVWDQANGYWKPGTVATDGGGAETLDELTDVTLGTPTSGQVLTYSGAAWVNAKVNWSNLEDAPSVPQVIDDLGDVDTSTVAPTPGQVLTWDGSNWAPATSTGGGGARETVGGALTERADVTVTTDYTTDGTENIEFTGMGEAGSFVTVTATQPCWVRLYGTDTARTGDALRPIDEDPLPGSGVLLEVRIKNANEIITISPGAIYYNNDVLPEQTLYGRVTNESGGAAAIGVTIRAFTQTHTDAIVGGTFGSG